MEHEHKSLRDEVAVLKMKTKAFALERSRSLAKVNITDNYSYLLKITDNY